MTRRKKKLILRNRKAIATWTSTDGEFASETYEIDGSPLSNLAFCCNKSYQLNLAQGSCINMIAPTFQ